MSNEQKREQSKQQLGDKWLLHDNNRVQRKTPFRTTNAELRSRLGGGQ